MLPQNVKKVIVVSKTHLDIGFTSLAADVLAQYRSSFIPAAVDLAFRINSPQHTRFVWTVGSFLIQDYLATAAPALAARLEEAIRLGYVRWHGLACTTHTELMDEALLEYDLSVSQTLDARFGTKTTAAKMTDVPGHTIAMVPALAQAGITFLHLGVNASSRVPDVPALFCWRFAGQEVLVNYAADYGEATLLENGVAMEISHTHDNIGPPSEAELDELYATLATRYPNAAIEAGTLCDFARAAEEIKHTLPVVEEEIGDTWIHGVASDPLKLSRFRRLLALRQQWVANGKLDVNSKEYAAFMQPLLLVAEHTWGMDCKIHLPDFSHWDKQSFAEARRRDTIDYASLSLANQQLLEGNRLTNSAVKDDEAVRSYSLFEASHTEQRAYLNAAVATLPPELAKEAESAFYFTAPAPGHGAHSHGSGQPLSIAGWEITVGENGQIIHLSNKTLPLCRPVSLGLFEYQAFDGKTVDDCYFEYGRNLAQNHYWSQPDFAKPGLRYAQSVRGGNHRAAVQRIENENDMLRIFLQAPHEASEIYGCPREIIITHRFGVDSIHTELYWTKKDALRSPEAIWLGFNLQVANPNRWQYTSLGQDISPLNVASGGNRKLHCVQRLHYAATDGEISILPHDAPLVGMGAKNLYTANNQFDGLENGFFFLLYNNRWGTNFKQWFEEDMRFSFDITF